MRALLQRAWVQMVPVLEMADEIAPTPADIALSLEWTIALLR